MKKKIFIAVAAILLCVLIMAWFVFSAATKFTEKSRYIYVNEDADAKTQVMEQLNKNNLIRNTGLFSFIASRLNTWERLKPGRFEIQNEDYTPIVYESFKEMRPISARTYTPPPEPPAVPPAEPPAEPP